MNAAANDGVNPEGVLGRRAGVTPATKTRLAVGESTLVMSLWRVRSCAGEAATTVGCGSEVLSLSWIRSLGIECL